MYVCVFSVNVQVFGYMGIDMRWIRTSTGIKADIMGSLPIKGELVVDPMDSKVVVKFDPPTRSVHMLTAKVEPVNLIVHVPKSLELLPFEYELSTLYSRENVRSSVIEVCKRPLFRTRAINLFTADLIKALHFAILV